MARHRIDERDNARAWAQLATLEDRDERLVVAQPDDILDPGEAFAALALDHPLV